MGTNEDFDLNFQGNKQNVDCEKIKEFVDLNKYPILKRLNMNFIRRLQSEKQTLVISIIDSKSPSNKKFLYQTFKDVALKNRKFVFSHLDYDEDKDILSHLRVYKSENPKIAIYNFDLKRFYVDKSVYGNNENDDVSQ